MHGADHYLEAERLLAEAARRVELARNGDPWAPGERTQLIAEAHVHAVLAQAAAAALCHGPAHEHMSDRRAWRLAAGVPAPDVVPPRRNGNELERQERKLQRINGTYRPTH